MPDAPPNLRLANPRPGAPTVERRPLRLDAAKVQLVEFMVEDLRDTIAVAERAADRMESPAARAAGAAEIARIGADLARMATFFEFDALGALAGALAAIGEAAPRLQPAAMVNAMPRVRAVLELVRELADALAYSMIIVRPVAGVCDALRTLAAGGTADLPHGCTPLRALELDRVVSVRAEPAPPVHHAAAPDIDADAARHAAAVEQSTLRAAMDAPAQDTPAPTLHLSGAGPARPSVQPIALTERVPAQPKPLPPPAPLAQPIPSARLDEALSHVGNLVVQANRLAAMPIAPASGVPGDVARAAAGIRDAVQSARAMPVGVLLARCLDAAAIPRDRADLQGETLDADSGVVDRLTGPLTVLLGACAGPSRIRLAAHHDDAADVLEITITLSGDTPAIHAMARAAIEAMHGTVAAEPGKGGKPTIRVRVPANPVFMHCTIVRIGDAHVAFPIDRVQEVIRPEPDQVRRAGASPVVMIRGGAAALLDGARVFGGEPQEQPYAVVVTHEGRKVAMSCTRAVAAQEIVVRPMDPVPARLGPVCGAGAMPDGVPVMIVDIPALVRLAAGNEEAEAVAA